MECKEKAKRSQQRKDKNEGSGGLIAGK